MVRTVTATILSGQTVSDAVFLDRAAILAIEFPTMTGTAVTISSCETSGGTFKPVGDETAAFSISSPSARDVHPGALLQAMNFVKLTSGSAEGADRAIVLKVADYIG